MAYDEFLAERVRSNLMQNHLSFEEKKMMGGLCYMVNGKMCLGVIKNEMMARLDPDNYQHLLSKKGCRMMDFTGISMKGFVFVGPEGVDMDKDLDFWIGQALEYNPKAKASAKKKK